MSAASMMWRRLTCSLRWRTRYRPKQKAAARQPLHTHSYGCTAYTSLDSTPRARRRRNRKPHTAVAPHYGAAAETTHIVASASARPRAGSSWRRDPEPVRGWRRMWRPCTRASTRLEQRLCHEMHSAARGATRARRERAFGAARSGAPERRRPQSCTTRRQAPAVSARRRLTDTAAPTHPCLRALHAYVERHTPCYQSKRAWFELDERAVGIRTAASGV